MRGREKPDEYVVLSAHFDSWSASGGATDNATGTVAMMEAMRILRTVLPNPRRTILVGHWSGEEQGLNGSRAFVEDHPAVVQGLQALFNQDNGTGRVAFTGPGALPGAAPVLQRYLGEIPSEITQYIRFGAPGMPPTGGSDHASFACAGAPAFGLGSLSWDYGLTTWHTNRDTYDKIVLDDLRSNAILIAALAYQASEDPSTMPRDRLTPLPANPQTGQPRDWPACRPALRSVEGYGR
jgi:Zn-dependent M28 family amino/carboxypeptidase